ALAGDLGLGHAEAIDPLADDVLGLLDAVLRGHPAVDLAGLKHDGEPSLKVEPEGWVTVGCGRHHHARDGQDAHEGQGHTDAAAAHGSPPPLPVWLSSTSVPSP